MEAEIIGIVFAGVGVAIGGVLTLTVQRFRRRSVDEVNYNGMPFVGALPGVHVHDWYEYRSRINPTPEYARRCRAESCEKQEYHWPEEGWRTVAPE